MPRKRGRPRKKLTDRKTVDQRIPVTPAQKAMIYSALAGEEFANWARGVLIREAGGLLGTNEDSAQKETGNSI
jgi:hypothetical protein